VNLRWRRRESNSRPKKPITHIYKLSRPFHFHPLAPDRQGFHTGKSLSLWHRLATSALPHAGIYDACYPTHRHEAGADVTALHWRSGSPHATLGSERESGIVSAFGTFRYAQLFTGPERPGLPCGNWSSPSKPFRPHTFKFYHYSGVCQAATFD
jgi:hypothetical protein